jgi:hypothetical protein
VTHLAKLIELRECLVAERRRLVEEAPGSPLDRAKAAAAMQLQVEALGRAIADEELAGLADAQGVSRDA